MTENTQVKLFGFSISNTTAVIVFFLVVMLLADHFYEFFFLFYTLNALAEGFPDLVTQPFSLSQVIGWVYVFSPLATMILGFYILIKCFRARKLGRNGEDINMRWFGLKLNRSSVKVLGIISIIRIVSSLPYLISQVSLLFIPAPITFFTMTVGRIIGPITLILICIYTLLVCIRANSSLNSNT